MDNSVFTDMESFREEGRLKPPYLGKSKCRNDECRRELNEEVGAYLHKDRKIEKAIVFCSDCSLKAQLYDSMRFPLILIEMINLE